MADAMCNEPTMKLTVRASGEPLDTNPLPPWAVLATVVGFDIDDIRDAWEECDAENGGGFEPLTDEEAGKILKAHAEDIDEASISSGHCYISAWIDEWVAEVRGS